MEEHDEFPDDAGSRAAIAAACESRSPALPGLIEGQYDRLRAMARRLYAGEGREHSLNPTALVHEAWLRLVGQDEVSARGSAFFRGCFAQECRRLLVERARHHRAERRGGGRIHVSLADQSALGLPGEFSVLIVNDMLETLAKVDPHLARLAELRIFGGLTIAECADVLDRASRTIDKDWQLARKWLRKELA
ncbi:MAG: RNA polymerase subunit sigma-70 [Planctomycetes bacterium]|nr:RNA polymerase subunit sigma-70 [Planctomycetota bacterium]